MDDKIEEIATVISDKMIELGYGMSGIETDLARAAYEVMTRSDGELDEWLRAVVGVAETPGADPAAFMELVSKGARSQLTSRAALTQSSVQPE